MNDLEKIQADLDEMAHYVEGDFADRDLATRLRHLLDGRDITVPPRPSEIIAHLEAGGKVQWQTHSDGVWRADVDSVAEWQARITKYGDLPAHDRRLVPIPEPETERVRLDQIIGRKIKYDGGDGRVNVANIGYHPASQSWRWYDNSVASGWLKVDDDGTVEVLKDGGK